MSAAPSPAEPAHLPPRYGRLFRAFIRNSLMRELSFRGNFLVEVITRAFWFGAQITLFNLIYGNVNSISGWGRYEFFAFMATGMLINTLVEAFFMPNCTEFSELIRTGNLDFALLKPVDTQFLVSLEKLNIGTLSHLLLSGGLMAYAIANLDVVITPVSVLLYLVLVLAGVAFLYSLMISMASLTVWFGRNQGLYEFWFYITIFSRYPRSLYQGSMAADVLNVSFSFVLPILLVVTVPAEVISRRLLEPNWIAAVPLAASVIGFVLSRRLFQWSLTQYRSASS
jgi:ABC-2 type transport system permease protein